jgi:hypothetical protein
MDYSPSNKGQSSIEVMFAVAIFVILAISVFSLFSVILSQGTLGQERQRARSLLSQGIEAARQIRNQNWDNLSVGTHGLTLSTDWSFSGSEDVTGIYHRTVTVTETGTDERQVDVEITWESASGRAQSMSGSTILSNWLTYGFTVAGTSNCEASSSFSGDWTNPVAVGSGDIGAGNQGTDVAVDYPYVFISGVAASSAKPDLFVFDVSTPASPTLVRQVNTGSSGIQTMSIEGDYLYAASANDSSELMIFDISNPLTTTKIGGATVTGAADGSAIIAGDGWVALGMTDTGSTDLVIFDVTNPTTPTSVGSFEVGAGVTDLAAFESTLYVATSYATDELFLVDMTNPVVPVSLGTYNVAGASGLTGIAYNYPNTLIAGDGTGELYILDVTDPAAIVETSSYYTGSTINDLFCVVDDLAFAGTTNSTKEFLVLDISDFAAIAEATSLNFPQMATGLDFAQNYVFISLRSNDALRIVTSTP